MSRITNLLYVKILEKIKNVGIRKNLLKLERVIPLSLILSPSPSYCASAINIA